MGFGDKALSGFGDKGGAFGGSSVYPSVNAGFLYRDDMIGIWGAFGFNFYSTVGTGSAASSTAVSGRPGIVSAGVSVVADVSRYNVTNGQPTLLIQGGAGYFEIDLSPVQISDGANNVTIRAGMCSDAAADQTNAVYFENDYANHGNSNNWFACTALGGVRTKVDTGFTAANGVYQRLRIEWNAAASSIVFKIGGVLVATIATNIPTAGVFPHYMVVKQLGAVVRAWLFDYLECGQTFSAAR